MYDAILEDLVYPAEIVGKRIRVKLDGSQLIKVHLDKNQQTNIEHKVCNYIIITFILCKNTLFQTFFLDYHLVSSVM